MPNEPDRSDPRFSAGETILPTYSLEELTSVWLCAPAYGPSKADPRTSLDEHASSVLSMMKKGLVSERVCLVVLFMENPNRILGKTVDGSVWGTYEVGAVTLACISAGCVKNRTRSAKPKCSKPYGLRYKFVCEEEGH